MKKILKHGNKQEHITTCFCCGCEFSYEFEDVIDGNGYNPNGTSLTYHLPYVTCPECGNMVYVYDWIPKTSPYWPTSPYGGPIVTYNAQSKEGISQDESL